jgi:TolB-like protein/class 3 adenylate cyclase/tetratricopeptide (TPR) repeat protein
LSSEHVERRLAAILAADVAGSCRLIGIDEAGTLAQLKALRKTLFDPKIAEHHGRVVKNTGDGALVEFASVVDAIRCADEIQRGVAEQNIDVPQDKRIELRIGIHVGDIIIDENDIFGDAVNIAVRLEGIAEPGGVCISDDAQRQVRGKVDIAFDDMGSQSLKNIADPMRAWRVRLGDHARAAEPAKPAIKTAQLLALPDKPSIAVLPFQSMSDDPGQEHFTDGVVEEIITGLSRMRWLSVIARNSSFVYKGRSVDVKQVGRELGVRYVLEGSVRKAGNRVRITGQLIDSITGAHLWADRFDGGLEDVFELQDKVTASVVGAIEPTVIEAEIERSKRTPAASAYDYIARGFASQRTWSREANAEALRLFRQALQLDPSLGIAYALASNCYTWAKSFGWLTDPASETAEGARLARRAIELGRSEPPILTMAGFVIAYLEGDLDFGGAAIDRAFELNPNFASAWGLSCWIRVFRGEPDLAIDHVQRAIQLSPVDAFMFAWQSAGAYAHFSSGRYEDALSWVEKALRERPGYLPAARMIVASAALAQVPERPETSVARLRELEPTLRISNLKNQIPYRRPEDLARFADGLRKAGLPE